MSDISDLFALDPLKLTRENIEAIIAHYRQARANFNLGAKQAGSAKALGKKPDLKVEDLGL